MLSNMGAPMAIGGVPLLGIDKANSERATGPGFNAKCPYMTKLVPLAGGCAIKNTYSKFKVLKVTIHRENYVHPCQRAARERKNAVQTGVSLRRGGPVTRIPL